MRLNSILWMSQFLQLGSCRICRSLRKIFTNSPAVSTLSFREIPITDGSVRLVQKHYMCTVSVHLHSSGSSAIWEVTGWKYMMLLRADCALPIEVADALSVEIFKAGWMGPGVTWYNSWTSSWQPCLWQWVLNLVVLEVPSNASYSMVLWYDF